MSVQGAIRLPAGSGKEIGYQDIPSADFRKGLLAAGLTEAYADLLVLTIGFLKEGYIANTTDAVQTILNRPPRTLEAYAKDYQATWACPP